MKTFIYKLLIFAGLTFIGIFAILTFIDRMDYSDDIGYKRVISKGEKSLIIGTSRSAQGVIPSIINTELATNKYDLPIFNFSFNLGMSPYGEAYYKAIKRKIGTNTNNNSLLIIAVDPWCLSMEKGLDKDGPREEDLILGKLLFYHRPNYQYLFTQCQPNEWFKNKICKMHNDGWLEVNAPMDDASRKDALKRKLDDYKDYKITKSDYRIYWLKKTIELCKLNGTVFLIRVPTSPEIYSMEVCQWEKFDEDMIQLSEEMSVEYISFMSDLSKYRTTDGNHLYKDDAKLFTKSLCDSIKMHTPTL